DGYERHNVCGAEPRVRALLMVQVNQFGRLADAPQSRFPYARARAHQGDDAAVMVRVHFLVEQINVRPVQQRPDDGLHLLDIAPFTEVRNAFDDGVHGENLARITDSLLLPTRRLRQIPRKVTSQSGSAACRAESLWLSGADRLPSPPPLGWKAEPSSRAEGLVRAEPLGKAKPFRTAGGRAAFLLTLTHPWLPHQCALPTLASASVKADGTGGITGTRVTVFFTNSAVRCTFNRSNRKVNFFSRSCPMRARTSADKSQNLRLKGPKAFFRVLYKNCSSVSEALRSSAQSLRSVL